MRAAFLVPVWILWFTPSQSVAGRVQGEKARVSTRNAFRGNATVQQLGIICDHLESLAPVRLSAEWDNVGLLAGDRSAEVRRIMTCLTVTADTVAEAVNRDADLIVVHHPLPFRPLNRLTDDTPEGRYLLKLLAGRIHIFSPHTAWDSAAGGINQILAEGLGLVNIAPLTPDEIDPTVGEGRYGALAAGGKVNDLVNRVKEFLNVQQIRLVGDPRREINRVAVGCGSAASFMAAAKDRDCKLLVTGEATFHHCLAAEASGIVLLLAGHFASERFSMQILAESLAMQFKELEVWCSETERDPIQLI
ncbi:MAG: Nif3-like dinuclear metal center hexameric protein [Planctomycetota bacterium]|nr:Nif3-like dinuclear metal center hexameric protein [Planctomycetota bacterium]